MIKTIIFIFYTEFILLLRRTQEWMYPLVFFAMLVCFFPFAFSTDQTELKKMVPGILWIAALLASLQSSQFIFFSDNEDNHLEQLLLQPVPLTIIVIAKLCAHWIVTQLPLILFTPVLGFIFHLSIPIILLLCVTLLLGTPILILIGAISAGLTFGLRQQGVLLSILVLPLTTPVLIFGVTIVQQFAAGFNVMGALAFLAGISLLTITFIPIAIATTLRITVDY